jgi:hypothetical protein
LLDEAKAAATAYVRAMPELDRAMIVRADAMATPATRFESNRKAINDAIRQTRAGATALRLADAIQFAREALRLESRRAGEIVYVGAGRVPRQDSAIPAVQQFRVLPVSEPGDNCGIRKLTLRRLEDDPGTWEIFVSVRNYGRSKRDVPLAVQFGGALIGSRRLALAPGEEQSATFRYRTRTNGWVDARLLITDSLAGDNHAQVEVPAQPVVRVLVYSDRPDLLRPILGASQNVEAVYASPSSYDPKAQARIVILDRFTPQTAPDADAIWIDPAPGASPFRVASTVAGAQLDRWHGENALGAGLGTKDVKLASTRVFTAQPGDLDIADCADGPVILARQSAHKAVAFGFHPALTLMRFELATPLLFANILRWMAPDVFRRWELNGGSAGTVSFVLDPEVDAAGVRVLNEAGRPLPFAVKGDTISFFTATPGTVRVLAGNRETVYSLTLPDVADAKWQPPKAALRGSQNSGAVGSARKIWPALALAGALGLILEWMLFGSGHPAALRKESA